MKPLLSIITALIVLTISSCSSKKYTRGTIPDNFIEFGYMDQKTNGSNTYILADNGQLFLKSSLNNRYTESKKLREKDAELIYTTVDQLKMSNNTYYEIGELTHFVRLRQGRELQEWKWDPKNPNLPKDLKTLDDILVKAMEKRLD